MKKVTVIYELPDDTDPDSVILDIDEAVQSMHDVKLKMTLVVDEEDGTVVKQLYNQD